VNVTRHCRRHCRNVKVATSVLFGPCAGVGWVALEPLSGPGAALVGLASMARGAFMEFMEPQSTMQRFPSFESGRDVVRRPADGTARVAVLVRQCS
jgi:hypothetical protein